MRKFTHLAAALLATGALTVTAVSPAYAQASPHDTTVPLGGSCVVNVTQMRLEGDCSFQIGGAIVATLAALGVGALGSLGSSGGTPTIPPVTSTTPTTTVPTTSVTPGPTTTVSPDPTTTVPTTTSTTPTTTVPTTSVVPDPESPDPTSRGSYRFFEVDRQHGFAIVRIEYLGSSPGAPQGFLSLTRQDVGGSLIGLDEGIPLLSGIEGHYSIGNHGEFILTYSIGNQSVEVGRWTY